MEIQRHILKNALDTALLGIGNNEIIEQSTSFCFHQNSVITYNDEVSVRCAIDLALEGVVDAKKLYAFVSKSNADVISFDLKKGELIVSAKRAKIGLPFTSDILLPYDEIGDVGQFIDLPDAFLTGLSMCKDVISKNSTSHLSSVHIKGDLMESSDNYRVLQYNIGTGMDSFDFQIPGYNCNAILQFNPDKIAVKESWCHFNRGDGVILSVRLYGGTYPCVDTFFPRKKGTEIKFPRSLKSTLTNLDVFSKRKEKVQECITLDFCENSLMVKGQAQDGSWFKERIKFESKNTISFMVAPYMLDIILCNDAIVYMQDKMLYAESNFWKYIACLKE